MSAEWEWCGAAHHFVGAGKCRFHMATWVNAGRYLVSTVGDYRPDGLNQPMMALGLSDSFFETYVFECDPDDRGNDGTDHPAVSDWCNVDGERVSTREQANELHLAMCRKWDSVSVNPT
jgi:hypothetical protein